jgi:hypothetical protein
MAAEDTRRIERLAERAKKLDDIIKKAAEMQKKIVDEIQQIGRGDRMYNRPLSKTRRRRAR